MIDYLNPKWVFVKIMAIMRFAIFCLELVNHKTTHPNTKYHTKDILNRKKFHSLQLKAWYKLYGFNNCTTLI